jgi:hypothetical protein
VVGCCKQGSRPCVQDEGDCATDSVMRCVGGVNGQFKKRLLLWNELPFSVESLDVNVVVRG